MNERREQKDGSAGRWWLGLGLFVTVLLFAGGALHFRQSWRVPPVEPKRVHVAALAAARQSLLPPTVRTPPPLAPHLLPSGEVLVPERRGDKKLLAFRQLGFPAAPGLEFLCNGWMDAFDSGFSATEQHFASPDTPAALIAFYRRRLGDKRMRRWGKDSVSWDVPVASSNPEIQQWKSVQIAPFNAITDGLLEGVDSRCRVQPRFWAFGEVTLIESGGPAHPRALIR